MDEPPRRARCFGHRPTPVSQRRAACSESAVVRKTFTVPRAPISPRLLSQNRTHVLASRRDLPFFVLLPPRALRCRPQRTLVLHPPTTALLVDVVVPEALPTGATSRYHVVASLNPYVCVSVFFSSSFLTSCVQPGSLSPDHPLPPAMDPFSSLQVPDGEDSL